MKVKLEFEVGWRGVVYPAGESVDVPDELAKVLGHTPDESLAQGQEHPDVAESGESSSDSVSSDPKPEPKTRRK